jgi:hypothetical protein
VRQLQFDDRVYDYDWWDGQQLKGTADRPLSLDLETCLIKPIREPLPGEDVRSVPTDPRDVPEPTLGMACDGDRLVLLHPRRFGDFVRVHRGQHVVSHNVQFDWWCLHKYGDDVTREFLWQWGDENRLHDTMILDQLLQLASGNYRVVGKGGGEQRLWQTNLGVLAEEWGVGGVDKTDEYRLRFGEFRGLSQGGIDAHPEAEGFFAYALKDVLATHAVYRKQYAAALGWMRKAGWNPDPRQKRYEIRPDAVAKFGVLSEALQTKASVVLAELSRTPIRIDQGRRGQLEERTRERHRAALEAVLATEPELVQKSKAKYRTVVEGKGKKAVRTRVLVRPAEVLYTDRAGVPKFNTKKLIEVLEKEAAGLKVPVPISGGKLGRVSTSTKDWKRHADRSPFVKAWVSLEDEAKFLEFLTAIDAPEVYSNYSLLMVTGRTSAGAHKRGKGRPLLPSLNVQQIPRDESDDPDENLRSMFLPPPGCGWAAIDYAYIEFRAMAAIARALYGESEMARVTEENTLRGGADPHVVTAAAIAGLTVEEFLQLPEGQRKKLRQEAKCANFGLMGGMGAETFTVYYRSAGGKGDMTVADAQRIKKGWKARYPEMETYLADSVNKALAWNCARGKPPALPDHVCWRLSEFLKQGDDDGKRKKKKRTAFTPGEVDYFWELLDGLAYRSGCGRTAEDVEERRVTQRVRRLVYYRSCTLTGRVRNYTKYTDERNSRFQGVSADGAKLALWRLMRRGYRLINFVHDEIGVAVPDAAARAAVTMRQAEKIMEQAMEEVLGQGVPVRAEGNVAGYWSKG